MMEGMTLMIYRQKELKGLTEMEGSAVMISRQEEMEGGASGDHPRWPLHRMAIVDLKNLN